MQLGVLGANLVVVIIPVIIGVVIFLLWKDRRLVKIALRNLGRRKTRNFLTVVGVMASVSLYVAFNIASDNTYQIVYNVVELLGGNVDFEVSRVDGEPFDEGILEDILQVEGVKTAAPRIQRYCIIFVNFDGNSTAATVVGIDPQYDNEFGDLFNAENESEVINDLVVGKNAIVSEQLMEGITWAQGEGEDAKIVNATVGNTLKLKYRSGGGSTRTKIWDLAAFAEVTGKVRQVGWGSCVFITLDSAQDFFPKCDGKVDQIVVEMDPAYADEWQEVQQRIKDVVGEDLEVFAPKQTTLEANQAVISFIQLGIFFAGATTLLAMLFLVFNTANMTIAERKYEIGVLRSTGFKKRHVFRIFLYELLAFGIAGSAIGIFAGIWLSDGLTWYFKTLIQIPIDVPFEEMKGVAINPGYLIEGFVLGVIFTLLGGLYPLFSITNMNVINALRPEARSSKKLTLKHKLRWIACGSVLLGVGLSLIFVLPFVLGLEISFLTSIFLLMAATGIILLLDGLKRKYLTIGAGVVLLAVGLFDVFFGGSIISIFALMIGSIIFTAGVLRGIGDVFDFIVGRIPGLKYVSNLASKNIARKRTRSTLTFGIFTICLALVIAIASIMTALEIGILDFVDQSLEGDLIVNTNVGAPINLSGNITRNIEGIHWANTSEGMIPACTVLAGAGARFELWEEDYDSLLIGVNSTNYAVANEQTLPSKIIETNGTDTFKLFKRLKNPHENACIISDRLAYELNVKVGQKTPIKISTHGNTTEFKVIGILHEDLFGYPQPGYFCLIDIDRFCDFGFDKTAHTFFIKLDRRYMNDTIVDPQVVADQIDEKWGDEYKLDFVMKEDLKQDIHEEVQQIGTFFNIITYSSIIVGLLVLATTMIKIVSERRREIGLLRTIGIKKQGVIMLILSESIFLALIGLLLGIIDGYILGYTFVQALGDVGPMRFVMPWDAIVQTTVVALAIAVIGAIFPAWKASRIPPAESLRYTG
jgi:putative ABC transport system permease protein